MTNGVEQMNTSIIKHANVRNIKDKTVVDVEYGLEYIKGNKDAYFFITGTEYHANKNEKRDARYNDCIQCGAIGEYICTLNKDFNDLNSFHNRYADGSPLYPVENGLFWLGCTKYEPFNLKYVCDHFMINEQEAYRLKDIIYSEKDDNKKREILQNIIDTEYKSKWLAEAKRIRDKYNLW